MRITVFGSGRWASFLAWYCAKNEHEVLLCGRAGSNSYEQLRATRANEFVALPDNVDFTSDTREALSFGELFLVAVSAQQLRSFCAGLREHVKGGEIFVLCMKGLENPSGLRLTQVAGEVLPQVKTAVWVGPGHPQDFVSNIPNCMVIDSADSALTKYIADTLSGRLIRFYYGSDLIGAEIGAASKNVIGIAAGILDGLGLSSLKGVLMARGAREVSRLVGALGGDEITVYGLCHLGDYEATLFSKFSHNRAYGEHLILKKEYPYLAEGAATARSLLSLGERAGIELPITRSVCNIIDGTTAPEDALFELFMRTVKPEFGA